MRIRYKNRRFFADFHRFFGKKQIQPPYSFAEPDSTTYSFAGPDPTPPSFRQDPTLYSFIIFFQNTRLSINYPTTTSQDFFGSIFRKYNTTVLSVPKIRSQTIFDAVLHRFESSNPLYLGVPTRPRKNRFSSERSRRSEEIY